MNKLRILIAEDDLIIAAHISKVLQDANLDVFEVLTRGESVITFLENNCPDLILMDINLAGEQDGIDTAKIIKSKYDYPIIFLTGNADDATFNRSKEAFPAAYITKPFRYEDLVRTIELISHRLSSIGKSISSENEQESPQDELVLKDRVFVRDKGKMVKLQLNDILYVEADRNYCKITAKNKPYTLSIPLAKFEQKVSSDLFMRIHRSHLINITAIDELDDHYVFINGKALAVSKTYKGALAQKLTVV